MRNSLSKVVVNYIVLQCCFVVMSVVSVKESHSSFGVLSNTVSAVINAKTIDLFPFKLFSPFLSVLRRPLNNAGMVFYLHFTVTFPVECECAVRLFLCTECERPDTCPALRERYWKK